MASMPSSGAISLDNARSVFGVGGALAMSQLYRGGGIVPNIPANSAVPTSGTISMSNLYGASTYTAMTVNAPNINVVVIVPPAAGASGNSTASVTGGAPGFSYNWAWVSGGGSISLANTTTATVTASIVSSTATGTFTGTLRCTVTDATSATAFKDISVSLTRSN